MKCNNTKYFLQPSIGLKLKYFEVAFATKVAHYINSGYEIAGDFKDKTNELQRGSIASNTFWENSLTIRAGIKNVKAMAQLVGCSAISKSFVPYGDTYFNFGLSYMFNVKKKTKEK